MTRKHFPRMSAYGLQQQFEVMITSVQIVFQPYPSLGVNLLLDFHSDSLFFSDAVAMCILPAISLALFTFSSFFRGSPFYPFWVSHPDDLFNGLCSLFPDFACSVSNGHHLCWLTHFFYVLVPLLVLIMAYASMMSFIKACRSQRVA